MTRTLEQINDEVQELIDNAPPITQDEYEATDRRLLEIEARLVELGIDISQEQTMYPPVNPLTVTRITKPSIVIANDPQIGLDLATFIEVGDEESPVSQYTAYLLLDCDLTDQTGEVDTVALKDKLFSIGAYSFGNVGDDFKSDPNGRYCRQIWIRSVQ